jgi:hypothetical protein
VSADINLDELGAGPQPLMTKVVPTLFGTKASGKSRAIMWVARQPVQCCGTTILGPKSLSASIVGAMIGSNNRACQMKSANYRMDLIYTG